MIDFIINTDDKDVTLRLSRLMRRKTELAKLGLGRVTEAIVANTVKNKLSGQVLNRKTGTLAKSINWRYKNAYETVAGTNVTYGGVHEHGKTITPQNGEYLHFKGKDGWARVRRVVIPKRPFLGPTIDEVFSSNEANRILDRTTQEWLKREFYD